MAPSHVLVPLDGSPLADEALEQAFEQFTCRLTVLNVVTPIGAATSEGGVLEPGEERLEAARDRADRAVKRASARAAAVDRPIETAVETGDPVEAILGYVDAHDVDHVVMGGHGDEKRDLSRRLLGTVAATVVGKAPVTVTVVR